MNLLRDLRARLSLAFDDNLALTYAEDIAGFVLGVSRAQLYAHGEGERKIAEEKLTRANAIAERLLRGEPLAYILGKAYFYDREFYVDKNVLIPRCDTETLVETVLDREEEHAAFFADLGTGSGILASILLSQREKWSAVGIDISIAAAKIAKRNCENQKVNFLCADMLCAILPCNQFDFIVSNPPYISAREMETLDKSVIDHEPHIALAGGADGLDFYRRISNSAKMYLKNGGRVYLEIGYEQGADVCKIFEEANWKNIFVKKDLGGRDRVLSCEC